MSATQSEELVLEIKSVFDNKGLKQALNALVKAAKQLNNAAKNVVTEFEESGTKIKKIINESGKSIEGLTDTVGEETAKQVEFNRKKAEDFKKAWDGAIESFSKKSFKAIGAFVNFTKGSFLEVKKLGDELFNAILESFFDMLGKMAASSITNSIFGGGGAIGEKVFGKMGGIFSSVVGTLGGFLGNLFGFRFGGGIARTGPYMLHAGEYVLPAEVVNSIRTSQRPALTAKSGGLNIGQNLSNLTLKQTVNIQTPASERNLNVKTLAMQLKQASREGMSWAVDLAKVNYKIGKAGEGQISL